LRDQREAFVTYLHDHLSGSDIAIQTVEHLRRSHAGTAAGRLFGSLFAEFNVDVTSSVPCCANLAHRRTRSNAQRRSLADGCWRRWRVGKKGDLTLVRTLEALAVGVQGKRCLWQAAQELKPRLRAASHGRLRELEQTAVRQWKTIEQQRRALAPQTVATVKATSPMAS
jgi:hypothetical protein